ncbi:MAG: hypothetical protein WCO10_03425 [bacterium]
MKRLKKVERQLVQYRVIRVGCASELPGEEKPVKYDGRAVEFLRDWGFKSPVSGQGGDWKLFLNASASSEKSVFYVYFASPSANNDFVDLPVKINEMKREVRSNPGYFLLEKFDLERRHTVSIDLGYASYLRYVRDQGLYVFDAVGEKMARWEIFCISIDHPLPAGFAGCH